MNVTSPSNFVSLYNQTFLNTIDDLKVLPPYIFIASSNIVSQFDLDILTETANIVVNTLGVRIGILGN
jgi:hypothetical protein